MKNQLETYGYNVTKTSIGYLLSQIKFYWIVDATDLALQIGDYAHAALATYEYSLISQFISQKRAITMVNYNYTKTGDYIVPVHDKYLMNSNYIMMGISRICAELEAINLYSNSRIYNDDNEVDSASENIDRIEQVIMNRNYEIRSPYYEGH